MTNRLRRFRDFLPHSRAARELAEDVTSVNFLNTLKKNYILCIVFTDKKNIYHDELIR